MWDSIANPDHCKSCYFVNSVLSVPIGTCNVFFCTANFSTRTAEEGERKRFKSCKKMV